MGGSASNSDLHVVVIGAGVVGSSIAFNLSRRNVQVTVIDADEPGRAASLVSFAWANARDKNLRHYHDLNRRSVDMWYRLAHRLQAPDIITRGGEMRWSATPEGADELQTRVKTLQSWGYPIQTAKSSRCQGSGAGPGYWRDYGSLSYRHRVSRRHSGVRPSVPVESRGERGQG